MGICAGREAVLSAAVAGDRLAPGPTATAYAEDAKSGTATSSAPMEDMLAQQAKAAVGGVAMSLAAMRDSTSSSTDAGIKTSLSPAAAAAAVTASGTRGSSSGTVCSPCKLVSLVNPRKFEAESEREAVVQSLGVVDTQPERRFDAITQAR